MLRTLLTKCHNYSERSLRSWWTWHGPRWNPLNYMTKNGNRRSHDGTQYVRYVKYARNARCTERTQHTQRTQLLLERSYVFKGLQSLPR